MFSSIPNRRLMANDASSICWSRVLIVSVAPGGRYLRLPAAQVLVHLAQRDRIPGYDSK